MSFAAFERQGWDRQAGGYARMLGQITDRLTGPLLDAAGGAETGRLLDVGCGHGTATAAAAARGAVAVGVDVSPEMLRLARVGHPGPAYLIGSAEAVPLRSGTCAAVVANFLVHHLTDPHRAVREFHRVLSRGGRVALTACAAFDRIAASHLRDGRLMIPISVRLAAGRVSRRAGSH
jgi:ubiquinone/menaquinone biosynthesis C-methylase UbiE